MVTKKVPIITRRVYTQVGVTSLVVIRRYISRWVLLFSGNKKVYFEVGVTL